MSLSNEQKCLEEILQILAKYGFEINKKRLTTKKKITREEHVLKKIKIIFGIMKNYEQKDEIKVEEKLSSLARVLKIKILREGDPIKNAEKVMAILGEIESIDEQNVFLKLKEVITFLENS